MLKAVFPVNVRAMNASYEMQFGSVERPTHFNTSYDLARYEVPGHRWSDLSEHGFGVALLSESKYGFSTFGNVMRLSLLRSPKSPDPNADMGRHRFAYAILPHAGDWRQGQVVAEGYRFNVPIRFAAGGEAVESVSFASVDDPNLVIDTIKRSEDGVGIIVRLYECHGARGEARLSVALPFRHATRCNILEEPFSAAPKVRGENILLPYRPFELISLKLT
jgi:alpha-mannosidase